MFEIASYRPIVFFHAGDEFHSILSVAIILVDYNIIVVDSTNSRRLVHYNSQ